MSGSVDYGGECGWANDGRGNGRVRSNWRGGGGSDVRSSWGGDVGNEGSGNWGVCHFRDGGRDGVRDVGWGLQCVGNCWRSGHVGGSERSSGCRSLYENSAAATAGMGLGSLGSVVVEEGCLGGGDFGGVNGSDDGGGGQSVGGHAVASAVSDVVGTQDLSVLVYVTEAADLVAVGVLINKTVTLFSLVSIYYLLNNLM